MHGDIARTTDEQRTGYVAGDSPDPPTSMSERPHNAHQHLAVTGTAIPVGLLVTSVGLLALGRATQLGTVSAVGAWLPLLAAAMWEVRGRLRDDDAPAEETRGYLAEWGLGSTVSPTPFVVVWSLGCLAGAWAYIPTTLGVLVTPTIALGVLGILAMLGVSLVRYYAASREDGLQEAPELAAWFRLATWLVVLAMASIAATRWGVLADDRSAVRWMGTLGALPAIEWTLRAVRRMSVPALVDELLVIPLFFQRVDPVRSVFDALDASFGVDLRSTWALQFVRQATEPLLISLALLGWLSTSLVTIDTFEEGIHERFGAPVSRTPLQPGLHLKAPWPIDEVHRIATARVRTMPLGYAGPKQGASLLWTKQHAAEEYNLLLGDGRDLVTINALLQYRISDAWVWHYGAQNPEDALRATSEQALLRNTVDRSLDDVLSENLGDLAKQIEADIIEGVATHELGVTIVSLSLQGLHPPVLVAPDYQAVISAQHEQEAVILEAAAYKTEAVQLAQARSLELKNGAWAEEASRLGRARGQALAFTALEASHAVQPTLFRFRRRLDVMEQNLKGQSINIVDDRIERDGGSLWFLR